MHIWDTVDKGGLDLTWEDVQKEIMEYNHLWGNITRVIKALDKNGDEIISDADIHVIRKEIDVLVTQSLNDFKIRFV